MAQGSVKALRLYGVASSDSNSSSLAAGTSVVHFRHISAIVEEAAYSKVAMTAEEVKKYTAIVEEVYANTAILPAPPGTVFKSRENLHGWLELHYFSLVEALGHVEGHSSARLVLAVAESPKNDEAVKQLQTLASEALRVFRKTSAATMTHPAEEGEEGVITKASFLVESDKWEEFANAVAAEAKRHHEFEFRLTGPWPPYDFVQMQFAG
ncbi:MAG: GvpL/GvpF family gas vesicle protein [Gemmatimonadaceae bacterium]|nr:GvpL/GvpF family gas vesicle protein [Gemmatimonadaceae bacterium]